MFIIAAGKALTLQKKRPQRRDDDDHAVADATRGPARFRLGNAGKRSRPRRGRGGQYKGMKDLGRGLIALAILPSCSGVGIALAREWIFAALVVAFGVVLAIAGIVAADAGLGELRPGDQGDAVLGLGLVRGSSMQDPARLPSCAAAC